MTTLVSGKRIPADAVMYSAGRQGATDELDLAAAGLEADGRGRIAVDDELPHRPSPHIYAVGDVIGFPALAATSMEQGRLAAYHAFGEPANSLVALQPIGIYTIPEISYCGQTEDELTAGVGAVRGGRLALPRAGPGADRRRQLRDARSCWSARTPGGCSGCTSSARRPPSWSTSGRRS